MNAAELAQVLAGCTDAQICAAMALRGQMREADRRAKAAERQRRHRADVTPSVTPSVTPEKRDSTESGHASCHAAVTPETLPLVSSPAPPPSAPPPTGVNAPLREASAKTKPKLNDAEFIAKLKADPTYAGIDIDREAGKMRNWCELKRKQATRARFLNWLNRAERTMELPAGAPRANGHPRPDPAAADKALHARVNPQRGW